LVETLAREAGWKEQEAHNDAEAACWEVDPPNGWGNTPPTSPIPKGWPSAQIDERCGTWPSPSEVVPIRADGWPDLSVGGASRIQVTIEVKSSVGDLEGHSTCRLLVFIGCLSVLDLHSFLCHSTVGTSIGSCAPCGSHGGIDMI
jgi:hypothetical protein